MEKSSIYMYFVVVYDVILNVCILIFPKKNNIVIINF